MPFRRLLRMMEHYSGCSKAEVARRLGLDRKTLRRGCTDPRLTVLQALASELDWPLDAVVEPFEEKNGRTLTSFSEAHEHTRRAYAAGEWRDVVRFAHEMCELAETPNGEAAACNYESGAFNALGLHYRELEALDRGLRREGLRASMRLRLLVNRANALFELGYYDDAAALAARVVDRGEKRDVDGRCTLAFAHYVAGMSELRLGENAVSHLAESIRIHRDVLASDPERTWIEGIVRSCEGALLEARVARGECEPVAALRRLEDGLDAAEKGDRHRLESLGRRCINAAHICIGHLAGKEQARNLALFLGKARDIAEATDNWSLWERVLSLDMCRRETVAAWLHTDLQWPMDRQELRVLVGTMGRFPRFRETGWKIFDIATLVAS